MTKYIIISALQSAHSWHSLKQLVKMRFQTLTLHFCQIFLSPSIKMFVFPFVDVLKIFMHKYFFAFLSVFKHIHILNGL